MKYLFIIVLLLSGCSKKTPTPTTVSITNQPITLITPPDHLLKTETVPKPPNKYTYLTYNPKQKERALTILYVKTVSALGRTNSRLKLLSEWKKTQIKLYDTDSK